MSEMNIALRKWVKKYIKDHFNDEIEGKLVSEKLGISQDLNDIDKSQIKTVIDELIKTREMDELIATLKRLKSTADENLEGNLLDNIEENLQSYRSDDLTSENWGPVLRSQMDGTNLSTIFDEISKDKPVHVRLGGFEVLFESDLSSSCNSDAFEPLLKLLKDGIADTTKTVFEASLKIHSKLLDSPRSHDVYTNLINVFEAEYHPESGQESLPNFATGINFKIFSHEKLLRILYVIIKYHKEVLKVTRNVDRAMEEMIDQFIVLLTYDESKKSGHCRRLSALNLVSIIEPYGDWSAKWMYSVGTRRTFLTAVSKSPSLLMVMGDIVRKGLEKANCNGTLAYSIRDDLTQSTYRSVYVSGDTVETLTYLHCLNFVSQLTRSHGFSSVSLGGIAELPMSPSDFLLAMVNFLNLLATSTTPRTIYNTSQHALKIMLDHPACLFDAKLGQAALIPLRNFDSENTGNLWRHTIDLIGFMMDSKDGLIFFTSSSSSSSEQSGDQFVDGNEENSKTPASSLLNYASNLLRQPIAVMNVDHLVKILELVGRLFHIIDHLEVVSEALDQTLYPGVEFFYNKIQKYAVRQENKSQLVDSAIQDMLLKITAWPIGLELLSKYPVTFEELIRGSINPFRHSWCSNEIISFLSSVTYFEMGCKLMNNLVPHTISMLLDEINNLETEENSVGLQDYRHFEKFNHVLSLFSLNTKCFLIFMMEEDSAEDESNSPRNLPQLFKHTMMIDSPLHYLSLVALETIIWNLDILIYLLSRYNLQAELLQLQDLGLMEVTKLKDENQEDDEGNDDDTFNDNADDSEKNGISEMHEVHLIDETSSLRLRILSNSYFVRHKLEKSMNEDNPEKCVLYSSFPPPTPEDQHMSSSSASSSELDELLEHSGSGLRDSGWVMQIRNAHRSSHGPIQHATYIKLLNQMERATAAVEWIDMFKWPNRQSTPIVYDWLPEDLIGLELITRFAEDHWENPENKPNVKDHLKEIFESGHSFIKYQKGDKFEGFDWFLGTIFIICEGNLDGCKNSVKNLVRFPSAIYMWHMHGIAYDISNNQTLATQFTLAQQIDSIVMQEFPAINYAMMLECGVKWWMICNRFLSQCFWGVLEWPEIVHFLTICILYPQDHIVYYCVSLLQHCEARIMEDIISKKYWPENIVRIFYKSYFYTPKTIEGLSKNCPNLEVLEKIEKLEIFNA